MQHVGVASSHEPVTPLLLHHVLDFADKGLLVELEVKCFISPFVVSVSSRALHERLREMLSYKYLLDFDRFVVINFRCFSALICS